MKSSNNMELAGLKRSLVVVEPYIRAKEKVIVTDRHKEVQKYLREEKPNLTHYFDVWHLSKGEKLIDYKWYLGDIKICINLLLVKSKNIKFKKCIDPRGPIAPAMYMNMNVIILKSLHV